MVNSFISAAPIIWFMQWTTTARSSGVFQTRDRVKADPWLPMAPFLLAVMTGTFTRWTPKPVSQMGLSRHGKNKKSNLNLRYSNSQTGAGRYDSQASQNSVVSHSGLPTLAVFLILRRRFTTVWFSSKTLIIDLYALDAKSGKNALALQNGGTGHIVADRERVRYPTLVATTEILQHQYREYDSTNRSLEGSNPRLG